jgi:hypothetical protein
MVGGKKENFFQLNFVKINYENPLDMYLIRKSQYEANFSPPLIYIATIFSRSEKAKIMKIIL